MSIAQAILRVPDKATPAQNKAVLDQITKVADEAKDCAGLVSAAQAAGGQARIIDEIVPEQQRPEIRALIAPLKVNQVSRPRFEAGGYGVYMRCPDGAREPEEKDVREALQRQKVSAFAERYLKELRRSAYVDIRV